MTKPKVFLTRRIPQAGIDLLADEVVSQVWPGDLPPSFEVMLESVKGMDGLVTRLLAQT